MSVRRQSSDCGKPLLSASSSAFSFTFFLFAVFEWFWDLRCAGMASALLSAVIASQNTPQAIHQHWSSQFSHPHPPPLPLHLLYQESHLTSIYYIHHENSTSFPTTHHARTETTATTGSPKTTNSHETIEYATKPPGSFLSDKSRPVNNCRSSDPSLHSGFWRWWWNVSDYSFLFSLFHPWSVKISWYGGCVHAYCIQAKPRSL